MEEILLISPTLLRSRTDLGVNYNDDDLQNAVLEAQDIDLRGDIGKPLYEAVKSHVQASLAETPTAIPADYLELLDDYISPYLKYKSYFLLLESLYTSARSNGLRRRGGDAALSRDGYYEKRNSIAKRFSHYQERLKDFVNYNRSKFAEYAEGLSEDLSSDRPDQTDERSSLPVGNPQRRYRTSALDAFKTNNNG